MRSWVDGDEEVVAATDGLPVSDGAWYAASDVTGHDGGAGVIDDRIEHAVPDRFTLERSAWIDDDTVVVAVIGGFATSTDQPLLTCQVPAGDCTAAIDDLRERPGRTGMGRTFPGGGGPLG